MMILNMLVLIFVSLFVIVYVYKQAYNRDKMLL